MNNDYIIIPGNLLRSTDLSMMQRLLYAKILGLDNDNGCYASNQYFADCLGVTKDYVSKALSDLKKKGYISIRLNYAEGSKQVESRTIRCMSDTYRISVIEGTGQKAEVKVKKEYKEEKESFDLFYSVYPRKQGKAKAWIHWKNNYSKLPISTIMDHCQKAYVNTEKGWIPHADTYLNQEKYYDEIVAAVKKVEPIRISEFKKTTTGHLIGYCHECDESSQFYKDKFDIQKGTHCKCNSTVYPIPKGGLNGSSIGNNR
tara:strand:- start:9 stop:782 length:774 start_codon:yes stop_codon:yes gene_type:complete